MSQLNEVLIAVKPPAGRELGNVDTIQFWDKDGEEVIEIFDYRLLDSQPGEAVVLDEEAEFEKYWLEWQWKSCNYNSHPQWPNSRTKENILTDWCLVFKDDAKKAWLARSALFTHPPKQVGDWDFGDFEAGETEQNEPYKTYTAGINLISQWGNIIECHGNTAEEAESLRDFILAALNHE